MARRTSRSHRRRTERRHKEEARTSFLSAHEALDFVDALDLPDGATFAMAAEMAGMEYGDFFDQLAMEHGQ